MPLEGRPLISASCSACHSHMYVGWRRKTKESMAAPSHHGMSGGVWDPTCPHWGHGAATSGYREWVGCQALLLSTLYAPISLFMYHSFNSQSILMESILLSVLSWVLDVEDIAVIRQSSYSHAVYILVGERDIKYIISAKENIVRLPRRRENLFF